MTCSLTSIILGTVPRIASRALAGGLAMIVSGCSGVRTIRGKARYAKKADVHLPHPIPEREVAVLNATFLFAEPPQMRKESSRTRGAKCISSQQRSYPRLFVDAKHVISQFSFWIRDRISHAALSRSIARRR